jgi:hypothetical protein
MADLITSTNPRSASFLGNANNLLTGTNPRTFLGSGYIVISGTLSTGTNPRSFSAFSNTGGLNAGTNARTFVSSGFVVPSGILATGTNSRTFAGTGRPGTILVAGTNPKTFYAVGGQLANGILSASTNPRSASILAALQQSENFTVLVMNLKNKVVSEYQNYNFNSACFFNGVYLGADKATGIHILSGANDNGAPIDASITLGSSNFGSQNENIIPDIHLNYSGSDELQVYMTVDEALEMDDPNAIVEGPFMAREPRGDKVQSIRAELPKGLSGGRHQFQITNTNGSSFNLQSIGIPIERLQRRLS